VPVSKPGLAFPTLYAVVCFMVNGLRRDMLVRFVDFGGVADHLCFNFVFTSNLQTNTLKPSVLKSKNTW
jgi:hypothetical protein